MIKNRSALALIVLLLLASSVHGALQTQGQATSSSRVSNEDIATTMRILDTTIKSNQKVIMTEMDKRFEEYDDQRDSDLIKLGITNMLTILLGLFIYRYFSRASDRRIEEAITIALKLHGIEVPDGNAIEYENKEKELKTKAKELDKKAKELKKKLYLFETKERKEITGKDHSALVEEAIREDANG